MAMIDFDGVVHRYSLGWVDGSTYDPPMPGAKAALETLTAAGYEVVIFSTRDAEQIRAWLDLYDFEDYRVTNVKEPAQFYLDDRAIRFTGWLRALDDIARLYPAVTLPAKSRMDGYRSVPSSGTPRDYALQYVRPVGLPRMRPTRPE